jgi:hypothetical protein
MPDKQRSRQDVQDDGIFDSLDDLVDVPLSDFVCDLASIGPSSLESPFACSSDVQWSCTPTQDSRNISQKSQNAEPNRSSESHRTEHARELGRRSQRRFRERKKVFGLTVYFKFTSELFPLQMHEPSCWTQAARWFFSYQNCFVGPMG